MKEERRLAKLEKKRHKEMRKQQKLAKKSKKRAKNDESRNRIINHFSDIYCLSR